MEGGCLEEEELYSNHHDREPVFGRIQVFGWCTGCVALSAGFGVFGGGIGFDALSAGFGVLN